ncbi:MAG: aminotransferase class III-fold pyridoxal phosphate-dependent enzyme [Deltaproteobacteria bacterium]|nr:aminotransferase class III-fold pyridoxal phosphate-dependent enzyme [Deltaproteobacteria bacterium]
MKESAQAKVVAILQARFSSSRLPGKVMRPILGEPMLLRQIERVRRSERIDRLIVATSSEKSDDVIAELCARHKLAPEHVVRLTGDCPLSDPALIDSLIQYHQAQGADYSTNALQPTYPDGLDVEVFRFETLKTTWKEAKLPSEREHVTSFVYSHPERFKIRVLKNDRDLSYLRWSVDEQEDFDFINRIYEELHPSKPAFTTADVLRLLETKPAVMQLNPGTTRNQGYTKSLRKDQFVKRYAKSNQQLERALKTIPLGSQTFSKSKTQYPEGVSPFFMQRAEGARTWDVDGNEYVDFVNGLCSITLGHCDADVTAAVKAQLEDGVIFSLPHPIEAQVAEKIVELVPCAELVRFGKNGSDATAGAVRLARASTGRDRVAVCGYHGWQDWYIGSTARNRGVPKATRDLTHQFTYNNLDSLAALFKQHPGEFAAVILEPMNVTQPEKGFLEGVKELTHKHGALLVFDETITGFRYAKGGAQERFGVTPDLATFGKGMANGFPVSAIAGKADHMRLMEEIFFSFTYGGETLSLAAALATMRKLELEPVVDTLKKQGTKVMEGTRSLIARHKLGEALSVAGDPTWSFLLMKDAGRYTSWQLKTLFLQEVFARGLLTIGTHNMSYAHGDAEVEKLLTVYDEVFGLLSEAMTENSLEKMLLTKTLEPLFKVR